MVAQISDRKELERRLEQARRLARMAKFFLALIAVALAALIGAFVFAAFTM
jgi:hypothetical protein